MGFERVKISGKRETSVRDIKMSKMEMKIGFVGGF